MNKLVISLLLFAIAIGSACADTFSIPTPGCTAFLQDDTRGEVLTAPDYANISSPGDPALPFREVHVILPPDADPTSITVALSGANAEMLPGDYDIAPAPPMVTVIDGQEISDWGTGKRIQDGRNMLVYDSDAFYPAKSLELSGVGDMRKWRIARIRYYPYRYNPVTRRIELTSGGEIAVSYGVTSTVNAAALEESDPVVVGQLSELAANYAEALSWYDDTSRASTTSEASPQVANEYMILTTAAIASGSTKLQAFASSKAARGFNVEVVTESQWGGGTGDAAANKIRAYLKANYVSKGIKYLLLIGSPSPSTGTVPMKMLWPRHNSGTYQEAPSDYFYADLTGNWDLDADGYFGEQDDDFGAGGIDVLPELIVGRIPFYGSFTELDSILQKIMNYESGVFSGQWNKNVLFSAKPSDANTPGYHLGEAIKTDAVLPAGMTTTRVYEQVYGLNPAPEVVGCTYDSVVRTWQKGAGFHFWWTHGNENTAVDIVSTDRAPSLDDRYPSFTFQCSCLNSYPERTDNLAYALLKKGAIATNAATRVSWYYPGQTVFSQTDSNAGLTYRYALKLIRDHLPCGDAHYQMMVEVPKDIWMNHCVFNIYGDPSLAYAAGPRIVHTPLPDTDITTAPYAVTATVTTNGPLAAGSPVVRWNTDGGSAFNSAAMALVSGVTYQGKIPAQPSGTTIYYYIHAADTAAQTGTSPAGAPAEVNSFSVLPDTQPPTIQHKPLSNTGNATGPYIVRATVTDDRGLGSVTLSYNKNGGADITVPMLPQGENVYEAQIPGPVTTGSVISYYISATDTSLNRNTTREPAGSYNSFVVGVRTRVAIYSTTTKPGYFFGSITANCSAQVADILNSDIAQRFTVTTVTSLTAATLAGQDALVLADNATQYADMQSVSNWFVAGKTIVALESGACYAAQSGYLWPGAVNTNGYGTYWQYNAGVNDQQIMLADPITADYSVGQVIDSNGYEAAFLVSALTPDTKVLSASKNNPIYAYVVCRDVPGHGKFVGFGPYSKISSSEYPLILESLASHTPVVVPKAIRVTAPNGGETFTVGQSVQITFQTSGNWPATDKVKLEYSTGLGGTWKQIPGAQSLANSAGSYSWDTTGASESASYKVRASLAGGSLADESDAPFSLTIPTSRVIEITWPVLGSGWFVGETAGIQWETSGDWVSGDKVKLEYSTGLTTTWYPIPGAEYVNHDEGSCIWRTTGLPASQTYKIRVTMVGGSVYGESDTFMLAQARTIQLTAPNGGEVFGIGQTVEVKYHMDGYWRPSDKVRLEYSTGLDSAWRQIPGAQSLRFDVGSFSWNTTGLPASSLYKLRASLVDGPASDSSDAPFSLIMPGMKIADAKLVSYGQTVTLSGKTITYDANGYCYIQEPDGSAGIRLRSAPVLPVASQVTVVGVLSTVYGECVVDVTSAQVSGAATPAVPLSIKTTAIGGGRFGKQAGVMEYRSMYGGKYLSSATGPNNIGLLVRVSGVVTQVGANYFYVNDGSNCDDGSGVLGVRVSCPGSVTKPSLGSSVTVTGVSCPYVKTYLFRGILLTSLGN